MHEGILILLIVFLAGVLGQNDLVAIAAAILLTLVLTGTPTMFAFLDRYAVEVGVIFLLIGLLLPFALGRMGLAGVTQSLLNTDGIVAVAVGMLAAWLASEGTRFLSQQPGVMVGLMVGSILGVSLIGGIPAGPLVAAGIAAVLLRLLRL